MSSPVSAATTGECRKSTTVRSQIISPISAAPQRRPTGRTCMPRRSPTIGSSSPATRRRGAPRTAARTQRHAPLFTKHDLTPAGFVLGTFHRPENVDDPAVLETIPRAVLASLPVPVVLPLHPRTCIRISTHAKLAALAARLTVLEPLGYAEFLGFAAESAMLISDSGGVQEEASLLKRPVVVVRRSTERPEVLGTFAGFRSHLVRRSRSKRAWLGDVAALTTGWRRSPAGTATALHRRAVDGIGALVDA